MIWLDDIKHRLFWDGASCRNLRRHMDDGETHQKPADEKAQQDLREEQGDAQRQSFKQEEPEESMTPMSLGFRLQVTVRLMWITNLQMQV